MLKYTLRRTRRARRKTQLFGERLAKRIFLLHRPQGRDSGVNAIIGRWPGNETDDEVFTQLEEIS
jgi:hypothetical protein